MGRVEWELAYIITQHLKPECRGLQTQCALTALPLNAKQTYIKQHKKKENCFVWVFFLQFYFMAELCCRTKRDSTSKCTEHQKPNINWAVQSKDRLRDQKHMALSARSGICVCVAQGPKPFHKVLHWKDNWSAVPEGLAVMKLFLCFCPQLRVCGHFRRTLVLFFCAVSVETKQVCFTA